MGVIALILAAWAARKASAADAKCAEAEGGGRPVKGIPVTADLVFC
jgi:hypothetical protein